MVDSINKYLFISDIHSNYQDLIKLRKLPEYTDPQTKFIFCGDYIDGQDQTELAGIKVIRFIKELCDKNKAIALLGNHDQFFIETARGSESQFERWKLNGGSQTWQSWKLCSTNFLEIKQQLKQNFQSEINFLASLKLIWHNDRILAVHAGINWERDIEHQIPLDLLWIRDAYFYELLSNIPHRNLSQKVIVSGHTPTYFLNGNPTCPIEVLRHDVTDIPRYVIDGGCKSGIGNELNVLVLKADGMFVRGGKIGALI